MFVVLLLLLVLAPMPLRLTLLPVAGVGRKGATGLALRLVPRALRMGDLGTLSELPLDGLHTNVSSLVGPAGMVAMALRRVAAAAAAAAAAAPTPIPPPRVGDAEVRYADAGGGDVRCDIASRPADCGGCCGCCCCAGAPALAGVKLSRVAAE